MLEGCRDCVRLFVCVSLCPSVLLVSAWMFLHMCPYLDIVCVYVSLCVSVCTFLSVRKCMYGCMCVGLFMLHQWSERALSCCRAIYVSVCYVAGRRWLARRLPISRGRLRVGREATRLEGEELQPSA